MSVPEMERNATVFQLTWQEPEYLSIRVDRLHTEKAGVYGEILIRSTSPAYPPHVHGPVHFNFISTTARTQLVKHLTNMMDLNWSTILEQVCYRVVEEHRLGTPAIHMADREMPEALGMRIAPLLKERAPTILFGEGDSLKSYFATFLAVITRLGTPQVGLTPEPGNVLYLDYEEEEDTFWERLDLITSGLGVAIPDGLYWRKMVQPLAAEFPAINQLAMDHGIEFVIIDSAAPATLEPEKAEMVIAYFHALRSLNVTSLTIAHDTKNTKAVGLYPFGSVFWRNLARSLFHVKADRNQDDVAVALKHTKANNGRRLPLLGYRFTFDEQAVVISSAKPTEYEDLAQDVPIKERIRGALTNGRLLVTNIAEALGESENKVRVTLNRGRDKDFYQLGNSWGNRAFEE